MVLSDLELLSFGWSASIPCRPHAAGDLRFVHSWARPPISFLEGLRNHQSDVTLLFTTAAELLHRLYHCLKNCPSRNLRMARKRLQQNGARQIPPHLHSRLL